MMRNSHWKADVHLTNNDKQFANFSKIAVQTGESIVVVGENKVGKSNFIRALQLILNPGLSKRDRQLGLEHFWDGLGDEKIGETIEIAIELTDFTNDPRLMPILQVQHCGQGASGFARPAHVAPGPER